MHTESRIAFGVHFALQTSLFRAKFLLQYPKSHGYKFHRWRQLLMRKGALYFFVIILPIYLPQLRLFFRGGIFELADTAFIKR